MSERDLAEAIHQEILSPESVDAALDHWHEMLMQPEQWRVKDYADGWIVYNSEAEARASQEACNGAHIEPVRPARDRLWIVLACTSAAAIAAVLARQREAARTGPWDDERPVGAAAAVDPTDGGTPQAEPTSEEIIDALRERVAHRGEEDDAP